MNKTLRKRTELRSYQRIFVNKIKRIPGLILALPMGAGKTVTTLTAILDLLDDEEVKKVLIVAPRLVAEATWPDEIMDWEHTSLLTWTLVWATDEDEDVIAARKAAYETARDLIGMTAKEAQRFAGKHSTLFKSWKRAKLASRGKRWPYDMIVVDETSMFKNGRMRTAKKGITRFGVAVKARKYAKRVVLLTGTPAPKGLQNLWGIAEVADGGERLGSSKHWFLERWFTKDYMGWNWEPRPMRRARSWIA